MPLKPLILLLISHVLGDVIFTSYRLAVLKRNSGVFHQALAVGFHSGVHGLLAGSLLAVLGGRWLTAALLVFAVHFLIDFIRCRVEINLFGSGQLYVRRSELFAWISGKAGDPDKMNLRNLWPWLLIHILDQGAHVVSLYAISLVV